MQGQSSRQRPQKIAKCCPWALQEVTHLRRQNTISRLCWNPADVCPCREPQQFSDRQGLPPVLLGAQGFPKQEDVDRGREECHTVPDLSHTWALPGDGEKNHTEAFWMKKTQTEPWISLQSTEKTQTWALLFLVPRTLRWNGDIKMIAPPSPSLWSTRGVVRGDQDLFLVYSYTVQLLQQLMRWAASLLTPKSLEAFCGNVDDPYKD